MTDRSAPRVRVFEHDYNTKGRREVGLEEVSISEVGDRVFWIDLDGLGSVDQISGLPIGEGTVQSLTEDAETDMVSYAGNVFRFDITYVPFVDWERDRSFRTRKVRCLLGARFLITCHDGESPLVEALVRRYVTDFRDTSKAAVFLVYEMFHHVLDSFLRIHRIMQSGMKSVDRRVMSEDEDVIKEAARLHTDFLVLREIAHLSRNVLNHLASRASLFISVTTRPYLDNMSMTLERLDDDLTADRQIISDSVAFYVSMVSYRMNTSIKAMTAVNVVFVPLTLLAGIYGMNFVHMPERSWRYGYAFFWALFIATLAASLLWLKRRG